jgi:hypothetical protein
MRHSAVCSAAVSRVKLTVFQIRVSLGFERMSSEERDARRAGYAVTVVRHRQVSICEIENRVAATREITNNPAL